MYMYVCICMYMYVCVCVYMYISKTKTFDSNYYVHIFLAPYDIHCAGKPCHKLQRCPARLEIPNRQNKVMSDRETAEVIKQLLAGG